MKTNNKKRRILGYWIIRQYNLYDYISENTKINKRVLYVTVRRGKTFVANGIEIFKLTKKFIEAMDERNKNLLFEDFFTEMTKEESQKYFK